MKKETVRAYPVKAWFMVARHYFLTFRLVIVTSFISRSGFPYWPAKGMSVSNAGLVDVRFFGAHDRAWVPAKDCFLFSEKDPNNFRTKRQDILDSMQVRCFLVYYYNRAVTDSVWVIIHYHRTFGLYSTVLVMSVIVIDVVIVDTIKEYYLCFHCALFMLCGLLPTR